MNRAVIEYCERCKCPMAPPTEKAVTEAIQNGFSPNSDGGVLLCDDCYQWMMAQWKRMQS